MINKNTNNFNCLLLARVICLLHFCETQNIEKERKKYVLCFLHKYMFNFSLQNPMIVCIPTQYILFHCNAIQCDAYKETRKTLHQ